jgi:hypothetical protein
MALVRALVWLVIAAGVAMLLVCIRSTTPGLYVERPRLTHTGHGMGTEAADKARRATARLFEGWCAFADDQEIRYVLTCGTLLGAVRDGALLPWDDDVDVVVDPKDWTKVRKSLEQSPQIGGVDVLLRDREDCFFAIYLADQENEAEPHIDIVRGSLQRPTGEWEEFWSNELPLFTQPTEPCSVEVGADEGASRKVSSICSAFPEPYLEKSYGPGWVTRPHCFGRIGWESQSTEGGKTKTWECED